MSVISIPGRRMFAFVVTSLLPPPVDGERNDNEQNDEHSHGSRNER